MKNIILLLLFIYPLHIFSQVIADPALTQIKLTQPSNALVDLTQLPLSSSFKLKIPVYNRNLINALPIGTCKIKIGLGSRMILDPTTVLSTVNTSNYFLWTAEFNSGQVQITGDLIAPLPPDFNDTATFNIVANVLGNSAITSNFLVTNHNTATNLSDENPANNTSFLAYAIVNAPLPVTFTDVRLTKKECALKVDFDIENQINVQKYEVQISTNQVTFETIGLLDAANVNSYSYTFSIYEKYRTPIVFVRVKSVDFDGKFGYTPIKKVSGICNAGWTAFLYPNPVHAGVKQVTIQTNKGFFNGKYLITVLDATGKVVTNSEVQIYNTNKIVYPIYNHASGKYIIKIIKSDGTESAILSYHKF